MSIWIYSRYRCSEKVLFVGFASDVRARWLDAVIAGTFYSFCCSLVSTPSHNSLIICAYWSKPNAVHHRSLLHMTSDRTRYCASAGVRRPKRGKRRLWVKGETHYTHPIRMIPAVLMLKLKVGCAASLCFLGVDHQNQV